MSKGKRVVLTVLTVCVLGSFFLFCATASESGADGLPGEYYDMLEQIPDEVASKLPDEVYSEDSEAVGDAIMTLVDTEHIFDFLGELVWDGFGDALGVAARLCGILVISALFSSLKNSLRSEALSSAVTFCSSCAVFAAVAGLIYEQIEMVESYFERINSLMLSMIPVTGAVWAMGGNVSTAATGSGALYATLAVSENICAATIVPVSCICTALALCRGLAPSINLQGISSGVKKCYTFILGFIMTVLLAILSAQTAISASADTTAARAAKLVTSSVIPVVGGSVSDTLRTVASGVQYMKSIVGVGGIAMILILLLPTLISLLLTRFAFSVSGCVADLLGCEGESRLISDLGNVWACMIAVVAMTSVMFILAMTLFIRTTVAAM
ncbi:MAG: hypothetical protein J6A83_07510 [Clostridia bacterium]|nr:hypothetical protein [Clostridia bacterium]